MLNLLVSLKFLIQNRVEIIVILLKNKEIYRKRLEILVRKNYNLTNHQYKIRISIKKVNWINI
jgi:hypothetical protein